MNEQDIYRQLADLTLSLQNEPDNAELLMQRGQILFQLHDKNGAWQDLKRALELKPELATTISGEAKTPGRKAYKLPKDNN